MWYRLMPSGDNSLQNASQLPVASGRGHRHAATDRGQPNLQSEGEGMAEFPAGSHETTPRGQGAAGFGAGPILWRGWLVGLVISLACWALLAWVLGFL